MLLHGRRDFQLHGFSRCLCARKLLLNAATLSHPGIFLAPEQIPVKSFFLFLSLTRMYTSVKFNPLSSRANGDRSWINHIYIFPIHDKRQPSHTDLLCFLSLRTSSALSLFHTFSLVSSFCTMVYHVAIFSNVFGNPVFFFYQYFSSFFFFAEFWRWTPHFVKKFSPKSVQNIQSNRCWNEPSTVTSWYFRACDFYLFIGRYIVSAAR